MVGHMNFIDTKSYTTLSLATNAKVQFSYPSNGDPKGKKVLHVPPRVDEDNDLEINPDYDGFE